MNFEQARDLVLDLEKIGENLENELVQNRDTMRTLTRRIEELIEVLREKV
jgi:hypothetical protein